MVKVNMHEAKTQLSQYVAMVESGQEDRVVLMRGNKPAAQIDPYVEQAHPFTFGLLAGQYEFGDIDSCNDEVAELFEAV